MAAAASNDDPGLLERRYAALSRLTIVTGLLGAAALVAFAGPLASWSLGSSDMGADLPWLAPVVFLGHLAAGHRALMQGQRRLKRLAALNILSALSGVAAAAPLYYFFGFKGVIPAVVAGAAIQFLLAARLSRQGRPRPTAMSPRAFAVESRSLVTLGLTFVAAGATGSIAAFAIRGKIADELGLESVGLYAAAWTLSGLFVKYVLDAMGTDYVPHLAGLIDDDASTNRAVNRQIEMGVLLSTAGLMATQTLAPLAIEVIYDSRFGAAVYLLRLFTVAMFGAVLFWPVGYVLQARAYLLAFGLLQAVIHGAHIVVVYVLIDQFLLSAMGYALIAYSFVGGIATFIVVRHFTGLAPSRAVLKTSITGIAFVSSSFALNQLHNPAVRYISSLIVLAAALTWSSFNLRSRLGYQSWRAALRRRA